MQTRFYIYNDCTLQRSSSSVISYTFYLQTSSISTCYTLLLRFLNVQQFVVCSRYVYPTTIIYVFSVLVLSKCESNYIIINNGEWNIDCYFFIVFIRNLLVLVIVLRMSEIFNLSRIEIAYMVKYNDYNYAGSHYV